nr:MAG TPA: hypothetical protein [Caudoviricetes sp.]
MRSVYLFKESQETTNAQRRTKKKKLTQEFSVWAYRFVFDEIIYFFKKHIAQTNYLCYNEITVRDTEQNKIGGK